MDAVSDGAEALGWNQVESKSVAGDLFDVKPCLTSQKLFSAGITFAKKGEKEESK